MQPTAINAAWHRVAAGAGTLQTRLTVNAPGDRYEQEADRVADEVLRMPDPAAGGAPPAIQRMCPECKEEQVQRQLPEDEEEQTPLQAKGERGGSTPTVPPRTEARISGLRGGGRPLPRSVRGYFEPRFGRDLSGIRVHTGSEAAAAAREVRARAFTVGSDVAFAPGEYRPDSAEGRRLLAHELTHTVQQAREPGSRPMVRRQTLTQFRTALEAVSADHATIIGALFNHARFQPLVTFLNRCPAGTIEFGVRRITQRIRGRLVDLFGGYSPGGGASPAEMTVNPQRPEHAANPLEVADTVVHEFLHAILDLRGACQSRTNPYPLAANIADVGTDPELAGLGGVDDRTTAAGLSASGTTTTSGRDVREYMEEEYGPSASRPETHYVDLNRPGLELVTGIIRDLQAAHPGIGQETVSFDNVELLQAAQLLATRSWLNATQLEFSRRLFKDRVARERKIDPATFSDREYEISAIQVVEFADRRRFDPNASNGWGPVGPVWVCHKRARFTGKDLRTIVTGTRGRRPGGAVGYTIIQHT